MRTPRILIYTAGIGEGHDLPAELLAEALRARGAEVVVDDWLARMGPPLNGVIEGGSPFGSELGLRVNDVIHFFFARWAPTRAFAQALLTVVGGRRTRVHVRGVAPDAIVSTYPGSTEVLGRLRRMGRLPVPVASAVTDLSMLPYWASRGVDLHLLIHPESEAEVRAIAPASRIVAVRGLYKDDFFAELAVGAARERLGLPGEDRRVVVVSGGGWAVGDLAGAIEAARAQDAVAVALCGRMDEVRTALTARFAGDPDVRVEGFTDEMATFLTAADVLIHSTAGLTVLEALIRGCRVISYGWGLAHVRVNNEAYARFGLAAVAPDRAALEAELRRALATPRPGPDPSFAALPQAADEVLALVRRPASP